MTPDRPPAFPTVFAIGPARLVALAGLVGSVVGCSDPESALFPKNAPVILQVPGGTIDANVVGQAREIASLHDGARATVVADHPAVPPTQATLRMVKLRVDEGPCKGLEVEVSRYLIRPAP